ncbi:hypothetical protein A2U01_0095600, partial [Trifolium medium]|nr:hypothetical protein [Trifolium medium]
MAATATPAIGNASTAYQKCVDGVSQCIAA